MPQEDHMFTQPAGCGMPLPTFVPDATLGWEIKSVVRGNNDAGYMPGSNVSVACEKDQQRLVITTSWGRRDNMVRHMPSAPLNATCEPWDHSPLY